MKVSSPGAAVEKVAGDGIKAWNSGGSHLLARRVMQLIMVLVGSAVLWMFLYSSASPFGSPTLLSHYFIDYSAKVSLFLSLSLYLSISFLSLCLCANLCCAIGIIGGGEGRRMKGVNFGCFLDFDVYWSRNQ